MTIFAFFTTSYVLICSTGIVVTFARFALARRTFSSALLITTRTVLSNLKAFKNLTISLVLGAATAISSITIISPSRTFWESAEKMAILLAMTFIFLEKSLDLGANTTPPFTHWGLRMEPCLARPVPFCLQGFAPPPRTSLRVSVLLVPCLSFASLVTTA